MNINIDIIIIIIITTTTIITICSNSILFILLLEPRRACSSLLSQSPKEGSEVAALFLRVNDNDSLNHTNTHFMFT